MRADFMKVMGQALLKANPEDFILNDEQVAAAANAGIAFAQEARKANLERKTAPSQRAEYTRLRKENFRVKEEAKNTEIRVNHAADEVREAERKISELIKQKKAAENPQWEYALDQQIKAKETELKDRKQEYADWRTANKRAVAALKAYDTTRLKELAEELGEKKI